MTKAEVDWLVVELAKIDQNVATPIYNDLAVNTEIE